MRIEGFLAGSLEARARTSYLPDAPVLYDDLSLNEQLEYIARLHGAEDWSDRGSELLARLGLGDWGENLRPSSAGACARRPRSRSGSSGRSR